MRGVTEIHAEIHARAIAHVEARARGVRDAAREKLAALLTNAALPIDALEALTSSLRDHTRITLNFHPDRRRRDGLTVAEGLLRDGRYTSQFETGVTNGSPTAYPGGDRDRWEQLLFGGAYHEAGAAAAPLSHGPRPRAQPRPKYGALDLMHHADGASPRFGSCYVELSRDTLRRATFTWGDSHQGPEHVGTIDAFDAIAMALVESVSETKEALGVAELDVAALFERLSNASSHAARAPSARPVGRALDAYIEAQVHGEIDLASDVDALVIDPAFEATPTEAHLQELASRYGIALHRHPGFVLPCAEVPADFRGPRMVPLAARIAAEFGDRSELDAAVLGRAADALYTSPESWSDWGTPEETWQHIKQLWHVLVRYGRPRRGARTTAR